MKVKTWILSALALPLLGLAGCKTNANDVPVQETKYVKIETAQHASADTKLVFNGSVKEKRMVDLSFRVGGQISEIKAKEGDYVKAGQVLATLDKRDYEIQLQTNKAQFEQVKSEYERYKTLFDEDKLPANSFEKAKSGYLMAKAGYENAQNQLNDTELKAPYSGYIYQKKADNFQTIGAGYPVFSIIDKSSFEVVIGVPETQINSVRNSTHNYVNIENAHVSGLPVQMVSIGEKTGSDGLFEVKLSFQNQPDLKVSPGMSAEVTMKCYNENSALYIPMSAVFNKNNLTYVWLFNAQTGAINSREVQVKGLATNGQLEILQGLDAGDNIVTSGVNYLNEGQLVKPIPTPSATNIGGLL